MTENLEFSGVPIKVNPDVQGLFQDAIREANRRGPEMRPIFAWVGPDWIAKYRTQFHGIPTTPEQALAWLKENKDAVYDEEMGLWRLQAL